MTYTTYIVTIYGNSWEGVGVMIDAEFDLAPTAAGIKDKSGDFQSVTYIDCVKVTRTVINEDYDLGFTAEEIK